VENYQLTGRWLSAQLIVVQFAIRGRFTTVHNLPHRAEFRRQGHDIITSLDAGKANCAVPDADVLAFAVLKTGLS
jgi:hypothetical protein